MWPRHVHVAPACRRYPHAQRRGGRVGFARSWLCVPCLALLGWLLVRGFARGLSEDANQRQFDVFVAGPGSLRGTHLPPADVRRHDVHLTRQANGEPRVEGVAPAGVEKPESDSAVTDEPFTVKLGLLSDEDYQGFRRALRTTVWDNRREVARWAIWFSEGLAWFRSPGTANEQMKPPKKEEAQQESNPVASIAFAVAASAVLFRVGGRAAFFNLLGVDALQDSEVQRNLDNLIQLWETLLPETKFLFVLSAWIIAKVFVLDQVTFPLAVVNGIFFNGVLEGTLVSCLCATIGSSVSFFLSRAFLYEKTRSRMDEAPGLRALENAVAGEGAKAVFTLRLAPILPLPIGGYPYVYGITRLRWEEFALGTFAGSAKPYFLDAYLGTLFKGLSKAPSAGDPVGDAILIATFVATIATGSFASELAVRSFGELQGEYEAYDKAVATRRATDSTDERSSDRLMGNQDFRESLAFWGLRAEDFPSFLGAIITTMSDAQAQQRGVYAEQWLAYQREVAARPPEQGSDLVVKPLEFGPPSPKEPVPERWVKCRPEYAEAQRGWRPQFGSEAAQALLTAPVFFEAIGTYSNPELWPKMLEDAKVQVALQREKRSELGW